MAQAPEQIKHRSEDYKNKSWEDYTLMELGAWVNNFVKRSYHRAVGGENDRKALKDLYDAKNYLKMMDARIDEAIQDRKDEMADVDFEMYWNDITGN